MATYRTIRMSFWNDPAIESLPPADKLLYLYLFTCPHANNLGVLSVSLRKMAFETGLSEDAIQRGLAAFESSGRIVRDGGHVWVCGFIRHQCSTSPKILTSLRALFPTVESAAIRAAILERYPHLFGAAPYPSDRVSVPFGESEKELEKEDQIGKPEARGVFYPPDENALPIPLPLLAALQRDFPDVDVEAEINHIRDWQAKKNQPVRNWMRFLRTWLSNAVKARPSLASTGGRPSPGAFGGRPHAETMPLVRPFSEADKERSRALAKRALDALRGNGTFSTEPA